MIPKTVVHSDPDILGGTPVFVGTRVPVQSLFDYWEGGETLEEFLHQFPSVEREQALSALEIALDSGAAHGGVESRSATKQDTDEACRLAGDILKGIVSTSGPK